MAYKQKHRNFDDTTSHPNQLITLFQWCANKIVMNKCLLDVTQSWSRSYRYTINNIERDCPIWVQSGSFCIKWDKPGLWKITSQYILAHRSLGLIFKVLYLSHLVPIDQPCTKTWYPWYESLDLERHSDFRNMEISLTFRLL